MTQRAFAEAVFNPDAPMPDGLIGPDGRPAPKRFSVYRNNVASSLTRALEAAFPSVRKVVGDRFYGAMALEFIRLHPPVLPMLKDYGDAFAGFLETFPPVAHLGYLPDLARLDQAIRESYHAADSEPLSEAGFAALLAADLGNVCLVLAPSLRVVRSVWPIHAIWKLNAEAGPVPEMQAEDVVVLRPAFDPRPQRLPAGGAAFLCGLLAGKSVGDSLSDAGPADLAAILGLLIPAKAILGVLK